MEMPLRVLNLVSQLGISPNRIVIESLRGVQSLDGVIQISDERSALLIEKLRSMVLVWSATSVNIDQVNSLAPGVCGCSSASSLLVAKS